MRPPGLPALPIPPAHSVLRSHRLRKHPEDPDQGQQPGGAALLHPAVRLALHRGGAVRLRVQLHHPLPQQEGAAAALAPVPER